MNKFIILSLLIVFLSVTMCRPVRTAEDTAGAAMPLIIYKTRSDYSRNLPVVLDKDMNRITSYPGIRDVYYKGQLAFPTEIDQGYLIDNMGISQRTVYTSYTLSEYSELEKTPAPDILLESIIEREPFFEMYDCGPRDDSNLVKQANDFVKDGFQNCKKIIERKTNR